MWGGGAALSPGASLLTIFIEAVAVAHVAVPTRCTAAAAATACVCDFLLRHCRKFKGAIRMPNVGYRTNKKDRHVLPNGFKKVRRTHREGTGVACLQGRSGGGGGTHSSCVPGHMDVACMQGETRGGGGRGTDSKL